MEFKIGQSIWVMYNNKPVEIVVSKIVTNQELTVNMDKPLVVETQFITASFSSGYRHDFVVNPKEAFAGKEELMRFVFESR